MKWFWSIMALLAIATGVLLARRGGERVSEPSPELIASSETFVPPPTAPAEKPIEPEASPVVPPVVEAPAPALPETPKPAEDSEVASAEPVAGAQGSLDAVPVAGARGSVDATPVEETTKSEPKPEALDSAPKTEHAEPLAGASGSEGEKPALFKDQFEIAPSRMKPGENGVTIYDERFPVKGAGTLEDPMEISWEFLVSASETFQPRMGKKRLPERITMLDGKHVRVTGYVAFPIMAASQNEMLSMRNMWDGCCIGVPPTPYDALEVKLKGAATGRDRFTAFGTVEGTMKIDPYIKGNWLLGLYLMEDATLSQLKEGGDPGKHGGM